MTAALDLVSLTPFSNLKASWRVVNDVQEKENVWGAPGGEGRGMQTAGRAAGGEGRNGQQFKRRGSTLTRPDLKRARAASLRFWDCWECRAAQVIPNSSSRMAKRRHTLQLDTKIMAERIFLSSRSPMRCAR